jgi:hypothetical protein
MKNNKQTIIEWYLMEQEALKEKIFFNKMTTNEFLNEKKRIDLEFNDMFYDHIYEAFESGRQSGYSLKKQILIHFFLQENCSKFKLECME